MKELKVALLGPPVRMAVAVRPSDEGGVPAERGIYAWWAPSNALPGIVGPAHPAAAHCELMYIGICPDAEHGKRTMRDRLLHDHARRTRRSTLRRALASFLWQQQGWGLTTTADGRPTLDSRSEPLLTAWMMGNLRLSWVICQTPWTFEQAIVESLMPPLNSDLNARHPLHDVVVARRATWTAAARDAAKH